MTLKQFLSKFLFDNMIKVDYSTYKHFEHQSLYKGDIMTFYTDKKYKEILKIRTFCVNITNNILYIEVLL